MKEERDAPYIWTTWITKLIVGESHCFWASWFKAHNKYEKLPSDFDLSKWTAEHNDLVEERKNFYEGEGYHVYVEDQNSFRLTGENNITVSGKADLVALKGGEGIVEDCKTGNPRQSDQMQVMAYMLMLPLSVYHCEGIRLNGRVRYKNNEVDVPLSSIDTAMRERLKNTVHTVGGDSEPDRAPSYSECRFCDIGTAYCPDRIEQEMDTTTDHGLF